jgi:hypothetical protein
MIKFLAKFLSQFKFNPESWPVIRDVAGVLTPVVPQPKEPITDSELSTLLYFMYEQAHYFSYTTNVYKWTTIPKVKVSTTFNGWGYVEGRTKGIVINKNLVMTKADDDMDFTEYCILVFDVPSMLLYSGRRGRLMVNLINEDKQDTMGSLLGMDFIPIDTATDFRKLAEPVQKVLIDLFRALYKMKQSVVNPVEKVLSYGMEK